MNYTWKFLNISDLLHTKIDFMSYDVWYIINFAVRIDCKSVNKLENRIFWDVNNFLKDPLE